MPASRAPLTAAWLPLAKRSLTGFQAKTSTHRMPVKSAPSTAQIAPICEICCTTGSGSPITDGVNATCSPYQRGISRVNTALARSEEHTSELQSRGHLVCRLLLEKKY